MANETRSFIREMIDKRKAALDELRETNTEEYIAKLLESIKANTAHLTAFRSASSVTPRTSPAATIQEKLLGIAKSQLEKTEAAAQQERTAKGAEHRSHIESIDHIDLVHDQVKLDAIKNQKLLGDVIFQLKKLNKAMSSGTGDKSFLEQAKDAYDSFGKKKGRPRLGGGARAPRRGVGIRAGGEPGIRTERAARRGRGVRPGAVTSTVEAAGNEIAAIERPSVLGRISNAARSVTSPVADFAERYHLGKLGGHIGGALAVGEGALDIGGTLANNELTGEQKVETVAKQGTRMASGVLGAEAGGAAGAALGSFAGPVGTAVGGIAGGLAGGYYGPEAVEAFSDSISQAVKDSGLEDGIGRSVAVVMSIGSQEARDALTSEYKNKIAPMLSKPFSELSATMDGWSADAANLVTEVGDYTDAVKKGSKDVLHGFADGKDALLSGLASAGSSLWHSAKKAFGQIVEGATPGSGTSVMTGLSNAASTVSEGVTAAGGIVKQGASKAYDQANEGLRLAGKDLGAVSEKFESGGRGVSTVSSGKGDAGGVSYGAHQLSSTSGTMAKFLASDEGKPYAQQLSGLRPGSSEFNTAYKGIAGGSQGEAFNKSQGDFISRTHFEPMAARIQKETGLDVAKAPRAIQEAIYSTAVQYGPDSKVVLNALKGKDVASMSADDFVSNLQDYKEANVATNFKSSSPAVQASIAERARKEAVTLHAVNAAEQKGKVVGPEETVVAANSVVPKVSQVQQPAGATPTEVVGKSMPVAMTTPQMPKETQNVNVMNNNATPGGQAQAGAGASTNQNSQIARTSASIELGDIPIRIDDLGLVLLNIGAA